MKFFSKTVVTLLFFAANSAIARPTTLPLGTYKITNLASKTTARVTSQAGSDVFVSSDKSAPEAFEIVSSTRVFSSCSNVITNFF